MNFRSIESAEQGPTIAIDARPADAERFGDVTPARNPWTGSAPTPYRPPCLVIEQKFRGIQGDLPPLTPIAARGNTTGIAVFPPEGWGFSNNKGVSTMRNTVIGFAAAAAIITVGSTLSASACPYHQGYGGPRGEYGRGEYRPEFGRGEYRREFKRREYPRREFGRREYRREFEGRERPRREFGGGEYPGREYRRGEYSERGSYGEYRD